MRWPRWREPVVWIPSIVSSTFWSCPMIETCLRLLWDRCQCSRCDIAAGRLSVVEFVVELWRDCRDSILVRSVERLLLQMFALLLRPYLDVATTSANSEREKQEGEKKCRQKRSMTFFTNQFPFTTKSKSIKVYKNILSEFFFFASTPL